MAVHTPRNLDDALTLVSKYPEAHLLGGGTDLMVEINFNKSRPEHVVALRHVDELKSWFVDTAARAVVIGSGVPYAEMESGELANLLPALAEAARTVGSPQIRAAGTLGGNLGTCSPAGDGLPVLSALDAVVHLRSMRGERSVSFHEFMVGPKRNAREHDEIITSVTIPIRDGWQGYAKVGTRNAMVISVASACLAVESSTGSVALALGSVGPTIIRCRSAEDFLESSKSLVAGAKPSEDQINQFVDIVRQEARPIDDHRSTASYRRHAVGVLARRLIERSINS